MRGGFAKVPFLEAFFWHCNQAVNTTTNNYILYLLLFIYISPLFTVHYSQLVKFHFFDEDITNCELYAANWWIVCESSPIFQGFSIWVSVWLLPCVSFGVEDHRTLTEPSPTPLCWCEAGSSWGRDLVSTGDSWIEGSKVSHRPVTEGDLQLRQELVHALQAKRAWNLSSFYWFMLGFPIHCVLEIVRIESPFNKWWLYVSRKALADDNKWPKRNHHNIWSCKVNFQLENLLSHFYCCFQWWFQANSKKDEQLVQSPCLRGTSQSFAPWEFLPR